ncbi:hypothetical protein UJ101_00699 [Flavobacteriaceae bacterium UJ101]|nr:hypothetical protein UJ101_00699 [Flavobacteriaceae bacterium UJ101]
MLTLRNHIQFIITGVFILLAQVLIFSNTNLFSWLNPLVYSLFVFLFPTKNRMNLIIYSFILGLCLDTIFNTGGINAFALTFIAFIREPLWRSLSLIKEDKNSIATRTRSTNTFFFSVLILIFIHHLIIFSIENFNFATIHYLLFKVLLSSVITFSIILLLYSIFRIKIVNGEE